MKRANVLGTALTLAGLVATAAPAAAQATIGADLGVFSDYVWRGITYTNKFVLEPDAYVTIPAGNASITVGGWANIEPGQYDGAEDISERGGGASSFDLTEFDWWGEVGFPVGEKTALTAGRHRLQSIRTTRASPRTRILSSFTKPRLRGYRSVPKLAVWYDVDKIKGAYFEGSIGSHD